LDVSLGQLHPKLSNSARADFWRSWQVDDHIARFCGNLARSEEAKALACEPIWVTNETNRAREWVYLQLELYATDLKATSPLVRPAESPREVERSPELVVVSYSPTVHRTVNKINVINNTGISVTPTADETRTEPAPAPTGPAAGGETSNSVHADRVMKSPDEQRAHGAESLDPPDDEILQAEQRDIPSGGPPDKGNQGILRGLDGKFKDAVNVDTARRFGGVGRRAIEKAVKKGSLQSEGGRKNRRVSVQSLLKYFPPENNTN